MFVCWICSWAVQAALAFQMPHMPRQIMPTGQFSVRVARAEAELEMVARQRTSVLRSNSVDVKAPESKRRALEARIAPLRRNDTYVLIAINTQCPQTEPLIGTLDCVLSSSQLFMKNLWTHKDHRRKGVASSLLDQAIMLAGQMGVKLIMLEVDTYNTPAMRLYEKYGFQSVSFGAGLLKVLRVGRIAMRKRINVPGSGSGSRETVTDRESKGSRQLVATCAS
ncbi:unnamed protein product [Vitrella brassicaformis CCMP3155]|uniref:N-acetyltransferase domain-containing protein n=1 Tax=Vitrella brassicaformis (strain CCMP3155) TaxID=1169540 RepID=A0A0G4FTR6_VITBC|nr:unnamed protein product [Vitrella brassicaformis CCMP3155]|eukprot:CEM17755.1 unnamed protein product [Vitrella brassicaformis CCMP3155]